MRIPDKTHIQLESSAFAFSKKLLLPLLWLLIASCSGGDKIQPAPPLGNDASLSSLSITGATLVSAFSSSVTEYTTSVAVGTTSVDVDASTSDDNASVTINGGVATSVPLTVGENTIVFVVTAEDGTTTRTYTVVVARGSDNAHLSGLELPGANWDSLFDASQFNYALTVGAFAERVRIIPTADDADATIRVNEIAVVSGAASDAIELVDGSNIITVDVVSSDGSTSRAYTVAVTRKNALVVNQTVYVKGPNPRIEHQFGARLAMSGNGSTLIVGEQFNYTRETRCGYDVLSPHNSSIYEHTRDGGDFWVQLPKIREYGGGSTFPRGIALSADGSTLAVSGGWVGLRVYTRDGSGAWLQQELDISAEPDSEYHFLPVALSADGSTLAVGVANNLGTLKGLHAAYVFTRDSGGVWVQQAELVVYNLRDVLGLFKWSIALSGDGATLAVGGRGVYVFTRNSTDVWTEAAYLERFSPAPKWAPDWAGGIGGTDVALSRDGNTLAVGNAAGDEFTVDTVAVFTRNSDGGWAGQAYIRPFATSFPTDGLHPSGDEFGKSVALSADGSILAVGKPSGPTVAAYIFTRDSGGGWAERALVEPAIYPLELDGSISPIRFGIDVALSDDGTTLAVGGPSESSAGIGINGDGSNFGVCGSGAAYVFEIG